MLNTLNHDRRTKKDEDVPKHLQTSQTAPFSDCDRVLKLFSNTSMTDSLEDDMPLLTASRGIAVDELPSSELPALVKLTCDYLQRMSRSF